MQETGKYERVFTREEFTQALEIQTGLFTPTTSIEEVKGKIEAFLSDHFIGKQYLVAFLINDAINVREAAHKEIVEMTRAICQGGFIVKEQVGSLIQDAKFVVQVMNGTYKDYTKSFSGFGARFFAAVSKDDVAEFQSVISTNEKWKDEGMNLYNSKYCKMVDVMIYMRAFKCLDKLKEDGYVFTAQNSRSGVQCCTPEEFDRYFKVPEDGNYQFMKNAIASRSFWACRPWWGWGLFWEEMNAASVLYEPYPKTPWCPARFAKFVRPGIERRLDIKEWDSWSDVTDRVFEGEEVALDDPMMVYIEAEASWKRLRDFDMHVERLGARLSATGNNYPLCLLFFRDIPPIFAAAKGAPYPDVLNPEKKRLLERIANGEGSDEDKAELERQHPGYIKGLGRYVYEDNVGEVSNLLKNDMQFDIATSHRNLRILNRANEDQSALLALSALFGSERCFNYLVENGYRSNSDVVQCALAGGNTSIIEKVTPGFREFTPQLLAILFSYRRLSAVDWFFENCPTDIKPHPTDNIMDTLFLPLPYQIRYMYLMQKFPFHILPRDYVPYLLGIYDEVNRLGYSANRYSNDYKVNEVPFDLIERLLRENTHE